MKQTRLALGKARRKRDRFVQYKRIYGSSEKLEKALQQVNEEINVHEKNIDAEPTAEEVSADFCDCFAAATTTIFLLLLLLLLFF